MVSEGSGYNRFLSHRWCEQLDICATIIKIELIQSADASSSPPSHTNHNEKCLDSNNMRDFVFLAACVCVARASRTLMNHLEVTTIAPYRAQQIRYV